MKTSALLFALPSLAVLLLACAAPAGPSTGAGGQLDFSGALERVETLSIDRLVRGTTLPNILKLRRPLVDEARGRVYFAGTLTPWLGIIDPSTDQIVDAIDLHLHGYLSKQLVLNTTTGIIYLTTLEDQRLYRVDPVARRISAPVNVKGGGGLAVDSVNNLVYAAAQGEVRVYDEQLRLQRTLSNVQPLSVEVVPATSRLYLTTQGQTPKVKVFDTKSLTEVASYSMPGGLSPRFLTVADARIYVSCAPQPVVIIIDEANGNQTPATLSANVGATDVVDGALHVMTGYPFRAGYRPDDDGAYGVIEILDAVTGARRGSIKGGLQAEGFSLHRSAGKLYLANTGESYIDVFDLATLARTRRIDTGTSVEDIVVRPTDHALVLRNRLGGGNSLLLAKGGAVTDAPSAGNWPTATLLDSKTGRVFTLSHYQSELTVFDLETLTPEPPIPLGVARLRSDGLSTAAMNASARRIYVTLPELGKLVAVNLDARTAGAPVAVPHFDGSKADGPGLMQIAVNALLGRVYLFAPSLKTLFVYDTELSLLRTTDLSAQLASGPGLTSLEQVFSDDDAKALHVGTLVLDPEGTTVQGKLPEGDKIVAALPSAGRLYGIGYAKPSGPGASDGHERILEIDRSSLSVLRRFDLLPFDSVRSSFAFDFSQGLAYVGYFETGSVDVVRIARPPDSSR